MSRMEIEDKIQPLLRGVLGKLLCESELHGLQPSSEASSDLKQKFLPKTRRRINKDSSPGTSIKKTPPRLSSSPSSEQSATTSSKNRSLNSAAHIPKKTVRKELTVCTRRLMNVLNKYFAHHRWDDAAKVLYAVTFEAMHTSEIIWKAGFQVLCNHPKSSPELINHFVMNALKLKGVFQPAIGLDWIMYFFNSGNSSGAQEALELVKSQLKGRPKDSYTVRQEHVSLILQGYEGLLLFNQWHDLQLQLDNSDEIQPNQQAALALDLRVQNVANKAIEVFQDLFLNEGNWDIFITKYIDVMEFYGRYAEALTVLLQYCERNPNNPNGYIFAYDFLKEHFPMQKSTLKLLLKGLALICPSDRRILDLPSYLSYQDNSEDLEAIFKLLDYETWRNNPEPWKKLASIITNMHRIPVLSEFKCLSEVWKNRVSWWPKYHFKMDQVVAHDEESAKLLVNKAMVVATLSGMGDPYVVKVRRVVSASPYCELLSGILRIEVLLKRVEDNSSGLGSSDSDNGTLPRSCRSENVFSIRNSRRAKLVQQSRLHPKNIAVRENNKNSTANALKQRSLHTSVCPVSSVDEMDVVNCFQVDKVKLPDLANQQSDGYSTSRSGSLERLSSDSNYSTTSSCSTLPPTSSQSQHSVITPKIKNKKNKSCSSSQSTEDTNNLSDDAFSGETNVTEQSNSSLITPTRNLKQSSYRITKDSLLKNATKLLPVATKLQSSITKLSLLRPNHTKQQINQSANLDMSHGHNASLSTPYEPSDRVMLATRVSNTGTSLASVSPIRLNNATPNKKTSKEANDTKDKYVQEKQFLLGAMNTSTPVNHTSASTEFLQLKSSSATNVVDNNEGCKTAALCSTATLSPSYQLSEASVNVTQRELDSVACHSPSGASVPSAAQNSTKNMQQRVNKLSLKRLKQPTHPHNDISDRPTLNRNIGIQDSFSSQNIQVARLQEDLTDALPIIKKVNAEALLHPETINVEVLNHPNQPPVQAKVSEVNVEVQNRKTEEENTPDSIKENTVLEQNKRVSKQVQNEDYGQSDLPSTAKQICKTKICKPSKRKIGKKNTKLARCKYLRQYQSNDQTKLEGLKSVIQLPESPEQAKEQPYHHGCENDTSVSLPSSMSKSSSELRSTDCSVILSSKTDSSAQNSELRLSLSASEASHTADLAGECDNFPPGIDSSMQPVQDLEENYLVSSDNRSFFPHCDVVNTKSAQIATFHSPARTESLDSVSTSPPNVSTEEHTLTQAVSAITDHMFSDSEASSDMVYDLGKVHAMLDQNINATNTTEKHELVTVQQFLPFDEANMETRVVSSELKLQQKYYYSKSRPMSTNTATDKCTQEEKNVNSEGSQIMPKNGIQWYINKTNGTKQSRPAKKDIALESSIKQMEPYNQGSRQKGEKQTAVNCTSNGDKHHGKVFGTDSPTCNQSEHVAHNGSSDSDCSVHSSYSVKDNGSLDNIDCGEHLKKLQAKVSKVNVEVQNRKTEEEKTRDCTKENIVLEHNKRFSKQVQNEDYGQSDLPSTAEQICKTKRCKPSKRKIGKKNTKLARCKYLRQYQSNDQTKLEGLKSVTQLPDSPEETSVDKVCNSQDTNCWSNAELLISKGFEEINDKMINSKLESSRVSKQLTDLQLGSTYVKPQFLPFVKDNDDTNLSASATQIRQQHHNNISDSSYSDCRSVSNVNQIHAGEETSSSSEDSQIMYNEKSHKNIASEAKQNHLVIKNKAFKRSGKRRSLTKNKPEMHTQLNGTKLHKIVNEADGTVFKHSEHIVHSDVLSLEAIINSNCPRSDNCAVDDLDRSGDYLPTVVSANKRNKHSKRKLTRVHAETDSWVETELLTNLSIEMDDVRKEKENVRLKRRKPVSEGLNEMNEKSGSIFTAERSKKTKNCNLEDNKSARKTAKKVRHEKVRLDPNKDKGKSLNSVIQVLENAGKRFHDTVDSSKESNCWSNAEFVTNKASQHVIGMVSENANDLGHDATNSKVLVPSSIFSEQILKPAVHRELTVDKTNSLHAAKCKRGNLVQVLPEDEYGQANKNVLDKFDDRYSNRWSGGEFITGKDLNQENKTLDIGPTNSLHTVQINRNLNNQVLKKSLNKKKKHLCSTDTANTVVLPEEICGSEAQTDSHTITRCKFDLKGDLSESGGSDLNVFEHSDNFDFSSTDEMTKEKCLPHVTNILRLKQNDMPTNITMSMQKKASNVLPYPGNEMPITKKPKKIKANCKGMHVGIPVDHKCADTVSSLHENSSSSTLGHTITPDQEHSRRKKVVSKKRRKKKFQLADDLTCSKVNNEQTCQSDSMNKFGSLNAEDLGSFLHGTSPSSSVATAQHKPLATEEDNRVMKTKKSKIGVKPNFNSQQLMENMVSSDNSKDMNNFVLDRSSISNTSLSFFPEVPFLPAREQLCIVCARSLLQNDESNLSTDNCWVTAEMVLKKWNDESTKLQSCDRSHYNKNRVMSTSASFCDFGGANYPETNFNSDACLQLPSRQFTPKAKPTNTSISDANLDDYFCSDNLVNRVSKSGKLKKKKHKASGKSNSSRDELFASEEDCVTTVSNSNETTKRKSYDSDKNKVSHKGKLQEIEKTCNENPNVAALIKYKNKKRKPRDASKTVVNPMPFYNAEQSDLPCDLDTVKEISVFPQIGRKHKIHLKQKRALDANRSEGNAVLLQTGETVSQDSVLLANLINPESTATLQLEEFDNGTSTLPADRLAISTKKTKKAKKNKSTQQSSCNFHTGKMPSRSLGKERKRKRKHVASFGSNTSPSPKDTNISNEILNKAEQEVDATGDLAIDQNPIVSPSFGSECEKNTKRTKNAKRTSADKVSSKKQKKLYSNTNNYLFETTLCANNSFLLGSEFDGVPKPVKHKRSKRKLEG